MASCYQINVELLGEVGDHIIVEDVADSALALGPVDVLVFLGVGPQHIAQKTLVRYISGALNHFEVPIVVKLLAESSVHA